MRTICLMFFLLHISIGYLFSQQPSSSSFQSQRLLEQVTRTDRILADEICDNNKDDNNDGLVDCEDYSCYFKATGNTCNCIPSNTIWIAVGGGQLYWVNLQTKQEMFIGNMSSIATDIAWTPNGKLYSLANNGTMIFEVDPATANINLIANLPSSYTFSNAMTSDKEGNLIIAALMGIGGGWHIIKLNPTTGQYSLIVDLSNSRLISGGDLAFSAGYLYLSCANNIIAKVNPLTGAFTSSSINGLPVGTQIFGIVSSADGSLYLSDFNRLHKLNPETMRASLAYTSTLFTGQVWGMANYNDNCNSVECKVDVQIKLQSNGPFCMGKDVHLSAEGSGIEGTGLYKWTLPDRSLVNGSSISAKQSGWYKVSYYSETDVCHKEDSVNLLFKDLPQVDLGIDTTICTGSSLLLENKFTGNISSYLWQDGSILPQANVSQSGIYWLQVTNECGTKRDTIIVKDLVEPKVNLGPDLMMCPYNMQLLYNYIHVSAAHYLWSNGAQVPQLEAEAAGWYWLKVTNQCGTATDSILITQKTEGCECLIQIPNAFTPNNDGLNEVFRITSTCTIGGELTIYNRWGRVLFQTKDLSKGWSGYSNSRLQPNGTYIFSVRYRFFRHPKEEFRKGTFTLIK